MIRIIFMLLSVAPLTKVFGQGAPPITNINGTVCAGDNAGFRVTPGTCTITGWLASTGGVFQGSSTGQQVAVIWSSASSNAWVQVDYSNCTSSFLALTVNAKTTPTVSFSITSDASAICQNGNVTFSATMSNGSGSPNYNWYIDNILRGTTSVNTFSFPTSGLSAGSHNAHVTLTALSCSNVTSVTSSSSSFSVPLPAVINSGPTGSASRCEGTGTNTYTASISNQTGYTWSLIPLEAGSINSSGVVTWNGTFVGTATVRISVTGCASSTATSALDVDVTQFEVAISNGPLTRCQGSGTDTYVASAGDCSVTSYDWSVDPATAGTFSPGAAGYLTWSDTFSGTATISVTASRPNGSTVTKYQDVVVKPLPVIPNLSKTICSKENTNVTLTTQLTGSTYTWTATNSNATGASGGSGPSISQVLTNESSASGSASYNVTPTNDGCVGPNQTVIVTVKPEPVITGIEKTICSRDNTSIALTTTNSLTGTTYAWVASASGVTGASSGSGTAISQILNNTSSGNGTATYTVTPTANSCAGAARDMIVTVKPEPVVSNADKLVCSRDSTRIGLATVNSLANTYYTWTVAASNVSGSASGNGLSIDQMLTNTSGDNGAATYAVSPVTDGCTGLVKNIVVAVKPEPIVSSADKTICSGDNTNIQLNTSNSLAATEYNWTVNSTNVQGSVQGNGRYLAQMLTNTSPVTGTAVYSVTPIAYGCTGTTKDITVTVKPEPVLANENKTIKSKENTNITLATVNNLAATTYTWSASATDVTGYANGSGPSIGQVLTNIHPVIGSATYTVQATADGCQAPGKAIVVLVLPHGYALITGPVSVRLGDVVNYNVQFQDFDGNTLTAPPVTSVTWSAMPGSLPFVSTSSYGSQIQWSQAGSFTLNYQISTGEDANFPNIQMSATLQVTVKNVHPDPIIAATNNGIIEPAGTVTLSVSNYAYDSFQWLTADGTPISGETSSSYQTSVAGTYKVQATKAGVTLTSAVKTLVTPASIAKMNKIESNTITKSGVTSEVTIESLPVESRTRAIEYFDGLGRPVQSVTWQTAPGKSDIITPVSYDNFGRETRKYLPYANGQNGGYKLHALQDPGSTPSQEAYRSGEQYAFYQSADKVATDDFPYAESVLEDSPLNRIVKQGASGEAWQPLTDHRDFNDKTLKVRYGFNASNEVLLWRYDTATRRVSAKDTSNDLVYYGAGKLSVKRTFDEHNSLIYEYTDQTGKTLLKRVQAGASPTPVDETNYASTYYIYDDFGNLVCVLPPASVTRLASSYHNANITDQDTFLNNWAFRYIYDGKKRMTEKKVPGASPVYMVYDKRDRLVLTQDGNQRTTSPYYWSFTKYDELNRPILTGIKDTSIIVNPTGPVLRNLTQAEMQAAVNAHYAKPGAQWGEKYDDANSIHGYTNNTYPVYTSGSVADPHHYLTVTYYDNYEFRDQWIDTYSYSDEGLTQTVNGVPYAQPDTESLRVIGQVTGTKIKVLDGGPRGRYTWLKTVNYYDDKYRQIQSVSDNYKGGKDQVTNLYDFTGKVLKTKTVHSTNEVSWIGLVNAIVEGNNVVKTSLANGWTAGGVTAEQLPAGVDGWIECIISEVTIRRAFGLTAANEGEHLNTIDYAFWHDATTARFYENGSIKHTISGAVKSGDVIRIRRMGTTIKYYKNGVLLYTSLTASNTALIGDASIDSSLGNILIPRTSFNAKADSVMRRFVYDHAGRIKEVWHQVNATPEVRITYNEYNELGQLIDKKLHSTGPTADSASQSVDYRYNIRGWLIAMNEDNLIDSDAGDKKDYFSFQLGYNNSIGIGNSALYNGNISGMKWSTNLGLGDDKMFAYNYSYDKMNRILGATFKTGTGPNGSLAWSIPTENSFSESGYNYDLNGNIMGLTRKGKNGSNLDILTYAYGTGSAQSNQLLTVSDSGDKTGGFTEIVAVGDDYKYDSNGNLVWDKNKGGEEVLTNGSFTSGSSGWIITDTGGRLTFQNDSLKVTSHATASATIRQDDIILPRTAYVLIVDITREAGNILINFGNGGNQSISTSGKTVFTREAGAGNDFVVTIPATFKGRINSIEVKGLVVISYNHLNLPEKISKGLQQSMRYIYDATGRKISQEVYGEDGLITKKNDYSGEFFYENDTLKFINHEEGRAVVTVGQPEYQYNLKDHLGNVRLTFTTKPEAEVFTGSFETDTQVPEQSDFQNYSRNDFDLFDHTDSAAVYTFSQLLNGGNNSQVGLAKSLSVMPGDTIKVEVYAKYRNLTSTAGNLVAFASALTGAFGLNASMSGDPALAFDALDSYGSVIGGGFDHSEDGSAPKAYLNIILFDKNYNFVDAAYKQIGVNDTQTDPVIKAPHGYLNREVIVPEAGYAFIFLSNENATQVDVYFDDLKIEHAKSLVIQMDDYYPFGLTFNSYQRENSVDQRWKFQGQEHIDDLDLNWDAFKWRNHQPDIGRFFNVDPLADKYVHNSPYAFSENKVTAHVELEGLEAESIKKVGRGFSALAEKLTSSDTYQEIGKGFGVLAEKMGLKNLLFAENLPKDKTPTQQKGDGIHITDKATGADEEHVPTPDPDGDYSTVEKSVIDAMAPKATMVPSPGDIGESVKNVATAIEKGTKAGKILIENVSMENGQTTKVEVDSIKYAGDSKNYSWPTVSMDGKDTTLQVSKP